MRKGKNKESKRVKTKKFQFFYCLFLFIAFLHKYCRAPARLLFYFALVQCRPYCFIMKKSLINTIVFVLLAGALPCMTYARPVTGDTLPAFNADTAFAFTERQVAFGPRIPGSEAQLQCAAWMQAQLQQYCDTVYSQQTTVTAGDHSTQLRCMNLIGVIRPEATNRILLLAHWDSRPWADRDRKGRQKPIDGADDGASGIAVLLELARVLKNNPLHKDVGIDLLFADVEDYGKEEWEDDSYALGTQYWCRNPHVPGYTAKAGILLDMVGAKNARFPKEGYSRKYAANLVEAVWSAAAKAGYASYFVAEDEGYITDDHVPVNEIRNIPVIDIIHLPRNSATGFPEHWHTHRDNISVIDRNTLRAVGQSLLRYLYTL